MRKFQIIFSIAIVTVVLGAVVTAGTLRRHAAPSTTEEVTANEPENSNATANHRMVETLEAGNVEFDRQSAATAKSAVSTDDEVRGAGGALVRESNSSLQSATGDQQTVFESAIAPYRSRQSGNNDDSGARHVIAGGTPGISSNGSGGAGGGGVVGASDKHDDDRDAKQNDDDAKDSDHDKNHEDDAKGDDDRDHDRNGGNPGGGGVSTGKGGDPGGPAPVPEPGTMALFGSGLVVVGGMLRRRRASKK